MPDIHLGFLPNLSDGLLLDTAVFFSGIPLLPNWDILGTHYTEQS